MRKCDKCKTEKPLTKDYYHRDKNNKEGYCRTCKVCRSEYNRKYRQENKEYFRKYREKMKEYYQEYNKNYYENNKEYFKDYIEENKEHRQSLYNKNREHIVKYHKEYYKQNKKEIQEQKKQYYEKNKKHILKYNSIYRKENRHILNSGNQRRRAREKELPHALTIDEWHNVKQYFNDSCSYCGTTEKDHLKEFGEHLHQEHFIPVTKGGEYTHNNIIPACRSCNSSKNEQDFFEWYPTNKHYSKIRQKHILDYLGYEDNVQQLSIL